MGWLSAIGKIAGNVVPALLTGGASLPATLAMTGAQAAGAGLGAISQAKANNRGEKFGGQLDLERLLMDRDAQYQGMNIQREQEGRAGQSDAWRKLLSAQRVASPSARTQLSPYSVAPRQATGAETMGADALTQQVLARLQGGNPIAPVAQRAPAVDPNLLNAGAGENITGWLSALLPALGTMNRDKPPIMSGIPSGGGART